MPEKIDEQLFYVCIEKWLKDNQHFSNNDLIKTSLMGIVRIYNKEIKTKSEDVK